MTFEEAATALVAWASTHVGDDFSPGLIEPGASPGAQGVAVAPWRLDTPRCDRPQDAPSATARFGLWVWSEDPLRRCAALQALYFAAMDDPVFRLSETPAPEGFWDAARAIGVTVACRVEPAARAGAEPRLVRHPAALDIQTLRAGARRAGG